MGRFLVVLLAVVALAGTVYVVSTQRTGTVNFAKDNAAPKLNLQVTPTLADPLGKVNLHLEWTAYSGADHYQVNIFNLVSSSNVNDTSSKGDTIYKNDNVTGTSLDIPSLKAADGDYSVRLRAMNGTKLLKDATATYGYFEDQFSGKNLDTGQWIPWTDTKGSININSGKLILTTSGPFKNQYQCPTVTKNTAVTGNLEASVGYGILKESNTPVSSSFMSVQRLSGSSWPYASVQRYNGSSNNLWIRYIFQTSTQNLADIPTTDSQGQLKINRTGGLYRTFYDSGSGYQELTTTNPYTSTVEDKVILGVCTSNNKPLVSTSFDNFRLVWVK